MNVDYRNGIEEALEKGILYLRTNPLYEQPHVCLNSGLDKIECVTFSNFPLLEGEGLSLIGCTFENCGRVVLEGCELEYCVFGCVDNIDFDDCAVENSKFLKLYAECGEIITLSDSRISHYTFSDVSLNYDEELDEETYLCTGIGDAWIEHCSFMNIKVDEYGCDLFHYEKKKKLFHKRKELSFVDEDSCSGIEEICIL